jgi:fluoroquinolone transport system permease protein
VSILSASLGLDVRLQKRSRLYDIGIVVAVLMGLMGRFLFTTESAGAAIASFFLLGTGGTTYFFSAALVLMEKSEGTLSALRTSPVTARAYIISKVLTLSSFALLEGLVVFVVGFYGRGIDVDPVPLFAGLLSLSVMQTLIGLGQVATHTSITAFLIPDALVVGGILQLPFLYALKVGPPAIWYAIPSHAPFMVMLGASRTLDTWQWLYGGGLSVILVVVAFVWAERRFDRHIGLR